MRFRLLIKIKIFHAILIGLTLVFASPLTLAQQNGSFEYWQLETIKSPMNALAWFNIGVLYEKGQGVITSEIKAQQSYTKAIEFGYAPAMFNLGSIYSNQKDYAKASLWWEKAAEKNIPEGQYNLAMLYEKGWGVQQDPEKAARWYQRAAETAMEKYLDLYQQSKGKLKDQSAVQNSSVSIFDGFNIMKTTVATSAKYTKNPETVKSGINDVVELAQATAAEVNSQVVGWSWVYSQPEENYTIQLFATKEKSKTAKFIQQYALTEQAKVIPAIIKGTQYYKVILGSFNEWNDAAVEIGALPQDLRDQRPWVRKFASLFPELPYGTDTSVSTTVKEPAQEQELQVGKVDQAQVEVTAEEEINTEEEPVEDAEQHEKPVDNQQVNQQEQVASVGEQSESLQKSEDETTETQSGSTDDSPIDDVFTLYAKRQLSSSGLDDTVKQQLRSGLESIQSENHVKAFQQLIPLAQSGLPEAQYRVALLYSQGQGVGQDSVKAFEFMKLSAEQGHPFAQHSLAELYSNGIGVDSSSGLAAYWRQTAIDNIKKLEEQ